MGEGTARLSLVGASLLAIWISGPVEPGAESNAASVPAQPSGKAIFEGKGNCATCHGKDARGTPLGPDLADGTWLTISGTLQEITTVVRTGVAKPKKYPAPMPPMGGARLSAAEVDAVAAYVLKLNQTAR